MAYKGRSARIKGVAFLGFRYMKGQGFHEVEVQERVGKSVIWVCEKGPKGLTDEFYGLKKSRKRSIFLIDFYLKESALTTVKRDAKF